MRRPVRKCSEACVARFAKQERHACSAIRTAHREHVWMVIAVCRTLNVQVSCWQSVHMGQPESAQTNEATVHVKYSVGYGVTRTVKPADNIIQDLQIVNVRTEQFVLLESRAGLRKALQRAVP